MMIPTKEHNQLSNYKNHVEANKKKSVIRNMNKIINKISEIYDEVMKNK